MSNRSLAAGLAFAATLLAAHSALAQKMPEDAAMQRIVVAGQKDPSAWVTAESRHVRVVSDAGREAVARLLENLERLDAVLRAYTKPYLKTGDEAQKLTLYYLDRADDLEATFPDGPANGIGLYSSCTAGVQGFGVHLEPIAPQPAEDLVKSPLNDSLSYLFEAYARHFLYRHTTIRAPASFIDGFAQYFASLRFTDTQMVIGRAPTSIGRYLHFVDVGNRYSLSYADVLEGREAEGSNYAGAAGVKLEFDARSWLLTHYMFSSEANRQHVPAYLDASAHGVPATRAFESSFGVKVGDLSNLMWRYGLNKVQVLRVDMPELPKAKVDFTGLPRATGQFVLADAVLRSCPGKARGSALLRALNGSATAFPDSVFVGLTLSRAQVDWGNPEDALPWLTRTVEKNGDNFDAVSLLGIAHLRLAQGRDGAGRAAHLAAARAHLLHAEALKPLAPDVTLALLRSDILLQGKPDPQSLVAVSAAWQLAREVDALGKAALLAYAALGDTDKAAQVARRLGSNGRAPDTAAWAAGWQRRLASGTGTADAVHALAGEDGADAPFQEWTIANASVMQDVEYKAGLEKAERTIDLQETCCTVPRQR